MAQQPHRERGGPEIPKPKIGSDYGGDARRIIKRSLPRDQSVECVQRHLLPSLEFGLHTGLGHPSPTRKKPPVGIGGFFLSWPLKRYGFLTLSGTAILSTTRSRAAVSFCSFTSIYFFQRRRVHRDRRRPSAPVIGVGMNPNVRRDLALLRQLDHVDRRRVSPLLV
jgi:hypothetical protein